VPKTLVQQEKAGSREQGAGSENRIYGGGVKSSDQRSEGRGNRDVFSLSPISLFATVEHPVS